MNPEEVVKDLRVEMARTLDKFQHELAHVRTGRASPGLLDTVHVDYYGAKTPLIQLAQISAPEPRLLVVQPHDPSSVSAVEKAIRESDLGLNPVSDGKILRVPIPELTEERRKELVRHVRKVAEEFRVSLRNHRRDSLELLKEMVKEKEISEDDERRHHEKVEAETKAAGERLDTLLGAKEEQILAV